MNFRQLEFSIKSFFFTLIFLILFFIVIVKLIDNYQPNVNHIIYPKFNIQFNDPVLQNSKKQDFYNQCLKLNIKDYNFHYPKYTNIKLAIIVISKYKNFAER